MFLVNSRLGPFAAAPRRFPGEPVNAGGRPFSLSYGTIMPSSLTMVAPIASECSSYPPVSVLVRAAWALPRDFSRRLGIRDFAIAARLASRDVWGPDFPGPLPTRFHGDVQNPARVSFPVVPSVVARPRRHGNVCPSCIGCALRPRLSSRLTLGGLASPRKPWVFGGAVSRRSLATHACILTSMPSTGARASGFARHGKLPYQSNRSIPPLRRRA